MHSSLSFDIYDVRSDAFWDFGNWSDSRICYVNY